MLFDPRYIVMVLLPGLLLGGLAAWYTRSTFARYARVRSSSGMTGAEAAARLLGTAGVTGVRIEPSHGFLSDHYDPRVRALRLSPQVYASASLAAVGIACHEAGHALQHAAGFAPLKARSALVPVTQLGSQLSFPIIFAGLFLRAPALIDVGVLLFAAVVLFTLVTLPVEWDATVRAKRGMVRSGIVGAAEAPHAGAVLNAAFLTYVASAATAILTLLYYLTLARRR